MIILTSIILIISIIYFFVQLKKNEITISEAFGIGADELKLNLNKNNSGSFIQLGRIRKILVYLSLFLFAIMLLSSFIPTMFTGEHLSGLFLVIHVTIAPIFAITLAAVILFYSHSLRINNTDYNNLVNYKNNRNNFSLVKLFYWSAAFFSIPLLFSIILILFPILGTDLQDFNIIVHRISALILTISTLMLLYYILIIKKQNHSK